MHKSKNNKQRLLFIVAGVIFVLLLTIATAFALAHRARAEAERYLGVIVPLHIGSTYDDTVAQLHNANIPATCLPSAPRNECAIELQFSNDLQAMLHLAPPIGFLGDLHFVDGKLVHKGTSLGWVERVAVTEDTSAPSMVSVHQNKIWVALSPSDFTEYRKKAYSFNLMCIGALKACTLEELLPTINDLEHSPSTK